MLGTVLSAMMLATLAIETIAVAAKPNVLFIMADDLNTALSGYGHPQCKTPNLDKLAKTGVSFTRAYCQYPICGPSRASIMTGQYPDKNGVLDNGGKVKKDRITLPRLFRDNGYWVGRAGKIYHLGVPGEVMGGLSASDHAPSWDYVYNLHAMESLTPGKAEDLTGEDSTSKYPELREEWKRRKPGIKKLMIPGNHQGSDQVVVETADDNRLLADGMSADRAIELLRARAVDKKPFFLGVGFLRPHAPYVAPEKDFAQYDYREMKAPSVAEYAKADIPAQANGNDMQPDRTKRRKIRRGYYGSVSYMDRMVGRVLDELDRLGLRENTIIVFVSDHGYLLGEHNAWAKSKLWEESTRVPLIISAPGQSASAVECDHFVELVDLYPTVVELAGLPADTGTQGLSLAELLNTPQAVFGRQDAFIQVEGGYGLRSGKWAYMWYSATKKYEEGFMLFDMDKDPKQIRNLAANPEYAETRERLHQRLVERKESAKNG
ncbi:Arylsulfatase [Pontiella desulfatans]|uniref:Arylsulfatase n=1 Tax=Pontiella desulfatans TaxID=2750659 RepID=A0A6C2U0D9_PONDE|nr:sulfatase [Pontiella desulfatans]SPS73796.1 sulfatase S1_7 [Kiritimatiellales bacterium]VGO13428.1 Arylsulfatase [Pontiella desulfatans]